MKVDNIICKSTYDSVVNGDPSKYAESSGRTEFLCPSSFSLLRMPEFHKWHVTWYDR